MALHFTPVILEATYNLLLTTAPFSGWKRRKLLPPGDTVEFHVTGHKSHSADCYWNGKCHVIRISAKKHQTLHSLTETMAHEMIHIVEGELNIRKDVAHGKEWQAMADAVCKHHRFDRGAF